MKYTHIVFDIDGTLTDTERLVLISLRDMVKMHLGKEYDCAELRFAFGITGADAMRRLGFAEEQIDGAMRDWENMLRTHNDEIDVFPGVNELIDELRAAGCHLGIVTSKTRDQYIKDFERFDVAKHFAVSVTADDSEDHKPTAGPLLKYMELTGAKCEEMLYIGDSEYDAGTAKSAGVDFALAVWGAANPALEAKHRPEKPGDLLNIVGIA